MNRIALSILFALLIPIRAFSGHPLSTFWQLSENQLDMAAGGRANSIAVNPINDEEMFVASDSGGLFKTVNGGTSWRHIPYSQLRMIFTQSVAYVNSTTLLVSAKADFKSAHGGGVWRSTDGGETWLPVVLLGASARMDAYEISVGSGGSPIAVGTADGVYLSFNGGLTWTYSNVFPNGDKRIFSVLVEAGNPYRIYAAGPFGTRVATTNPPVWEAPVSHAGVSATYDMHAFGKSPLSSAEAYFVNYTGKLFRTEDGGRNWVGITAAPPAVGLGGRGTPFARAAVRTVRGWPWLTLFFSNGQELHRLDTQVFGTPNYSFGWNPVATGGKAPRDLVFRGTDPALLASSAGLHKTTDGGATWTLAGAGPGGYNALQINEVKGQWFHRARTPDLYVGTQDNGIVAAESSGTNVVSEGTDAFFIDGARSVLFPETSQITYATDTCCSRIAGRRLSNPGPWNDPPHALGAPIFLRTSQHLQNMGGSVTSAGLDLTRNLGVTWEPFVRFFDRPTGIARLGRLGDIDSPTVLYQPYRRHVNAPIFAPVTRLIRIEKPAFLTKGETVFYPTMDNFGGLGFNHVLSYMHPVFAIDPGNASHLIAPDVFYGRMMESDDGGANWHQLTALTNDVTNGGTLLFRTDFQGTRAESPIVTAISFCPANPDLVLVGTAEGGIYYSSNSGDSFAKINDTEEATYVTSFYWQDANTVFVGTYGRGLWKLANRLIAVPEAFDDVCGGTCEVLANDGSGSPRFDGSALVFEGELLGVRTEDGQLRELFVTSGSSVVFTGDQKDSQEDIAITVSDGHDTKYEPLPEGPDGWIATGVVFTSGDELTGTVFAESELSLVPPPSGEPYQGPTESPAAGQPFIRLTTSAFNGVPTASPEETFELAATDFTAGASYEVLLDGVPMKGELTADGKGSFTTRISAPPTCGYHQVEVRLAGDAAAIDGSLLLVTYAN